MKKINFRVILAAMCVASFTAGFTKVSAGPVRFDQVVQVMNASPGKAQATTFSTLRLTGNYTFLIGDDDDDEKKKAAPLVQDGRVITETRIDVVRDDVCDCPADEVKRRGFPKYLLLGLAAIPIAFILIRRKSTPTPTIPITQTPTPTPGMTPTPTPPDMTPTPTPGMTPTPTPPMMTPTPPPEPVPEPMTILLFGTGLASVGMAARRRFGKKNVDKGEREEE